MLHVLFVSTDINECEWMSPCGERANCTDSDGSFTCECHEGYVGDGLTCTGTYITLQTNKLT